jgi:FMN reductase
VPDLAAAGISGSPRAPSKSKRLLELALAALERGGCRTSLIDLAELPADALLARASDPVIDEAIAAVGEARIVVAATPTYRALYTGLLKCFFDLMPQLHLTGKLCLGLQTAAVPHHALSPDYGLRPLFMSLDGVPLAGVFATDDEFVDGELNAALIERIDRAVGTALGLA